MCARAKERYYTPTPTHPHTRLIMSNMCACATHPPKKKTKNAFRGVEIREIYKKSAPAVTPNAWKRKNSVSSPGILR